MNDTLGALLTWVLFLGAVFVVARPAIPFIICGLAVALVVWVIFRVANKNTPRGGA